MISQQSFSILFCFSAALVHLAKSISVHSLNVVVHVSIAIIHHGPFEPLGMLNLNGTKKKTYRSSSLEAEKITGK